MAIPVLLFISNCTSLTKSQFSAPLRSDVKIPVKADVEIGEKISGNASVTTVLEIFKFGMPSKYAVGLNYNTDSGFSPIEIDPYSSIKDAAAYNAVSKSNADVIVNPKYSIEENNYLLFSTVKVTVQGYKGTLKGLKKDEPVVIKKVVAASKVEEPVIHKEVVAPKTEAPVAPQSIAVSPVETVKPKVEQIDKKSADEETIQNLINKWVASWQSGDMETYRRCYASDFQSKGKDLNAWVSYKAKLHKKSKNVRINIEHLQITADANIASAVFTQNYNSSIFKDSGEKTLKLIKTNNEWKIREEIM